MHKVSRSPYVIAEIGQAHEGSLGIATSYVDLAANLGASAVKFQTHIAEEESSSFDEWRVKFSDQDESRYDYWKRISFTEQQWQFLAAYCESKNIDFLSSPFSVRAVEILESCNVKKYKIASGEVENIPMLKHIRKTGKPIIISTGLSEIDNIEFLVQFFKDHEIYLLHCVSEYPTPPEHAKMSNIEFLKQRFPNCKIGLSDHSGEIFPSLFALEKGIDLLEVHLVFDKNLFGPDTPASLEPTQFTTLMTGIQYFERMAKGEMIETGTDSKSNMKRLFGRSAFFAEDYSSGAIFSENMLKLKKPAGVGLSYLEVSKFFDCELSDDVKQGDLIRSEHFVNKQA